MESTSEEIPIESHRSWYRLHWLTWVMVLLVGGSLMFENLAIQVGYDGPQPSCVVGTAVPTEHEYGWPLIHRVEKLLYFGDMDKIHWPLLFTNVIVALVLLLSTASTAECYFRRHPKWQFTIQGIMLLSVFVSLLLTNVKYNFIRWRGDRLWVGNDLNLENILFFFIAVGLWCVFWTVWRLVAAGVGRLEQSL